MSSSSASTGAVLKLKKLGCLAVLALVSFSTANQALSFDFPTANRALLESNGGEKFFVGTVGKSWVSGSFGCVRSDGWQMHEGIDIRCLARDKRGEPTDPVMATEDGTVAYVSHRAALSNYGKYLVLRHVVQGFEVYSLYAHLSEIRADLKPGTAVKAGEPVATLGRTANTRQPITKDRAHVHFEVDLLVNDYFPAWFKQHSPGERNDHGMWNGQNLLGLDPGMLLREQHAQGTKFDLLRFIQSQPELCRVIVHQRTLPFAKRYPQLVERNAEAAAEGVAGYELVLNYNGVPIRIIPRPASKLGKGTRPQLLSVNADEYRKNPGRRLVVKKGSRWQLGNRGLDLLSLLTYTPR